MTPIIETIALRKCFGATRALHSLDLQVVPGEVFCLLGANGAGKSTTINLLLGFLTPTSGSARIAGPRAARRRAGGTAAGGVAPGLRIPCAPAAGDPG